MNKLLNATLTVFEFEEELKSYGAGVKQATINTYLVMVNLPKDWSLLIWKDTGFIFGCLLMDVTVTVHDQLRNYKVVYGYTYSLDSSLDYEFTQFQTNFEQYISELKQTTNVEITYSFPEVLNSAEFKGILISFGIGRSS